MQTGVGRTGTFFAWEQLGVKPDLVTLAKGLANGLPIGVLLVSDDAPRGFVPGDHATHLRRQPRHVRSRLCRVDEIDDELLAERQGAERAAEGCPDFVRRRHRDARASACCSPPTSTARPSEAMAACLERGLLVGTAGERTLRITPPLTISADEVDQALSILEEVLA